MIAEIYPEWTLATWTSTFWRGPFSVLAMWMWMGSTPDCWTPFLGKSGSITVLILLMMVKASNTLQNIFNPLISLPSPPHRLILMVGLILMVLCNLDPHHGLCNGTRVCLIDMKSRLLEVRIISGPKAGEIILIPHINFVPTESQLPFKM